MKIIRPNRQRWVFVIEPLGSRQPPINEVTVNVGKAATHFFGPSAEAHITTFGDGSLSVRVRATIAQPMDPGHVQKMTEEWRRWAVGGWGFGTKVTCVTAELEREPRSSPLVGSA